MNWSHRIGLNIYLITLCFCFVTCSNTTQSDPSDSYSQPDIPAAEAEPPKVEMANISDVTTTSAKGGSKVTESGSATVTSRGICWSSEGTPTFNDVCADASSVQGSGEFTASLTTLVDNTSYTVRAYAISKVDTGYGNSVSFETLPAKVPQVSTTSEFAAGSKTAYVTGDVISNEGYDVTERGVCWSLQPNPEISDNNQPNGEGAGRYLTRMTGLHSDTTYYVCAYAVNSKGTGYGEQITVNTIKPGNITYTLQKQSNPTEELKEHYDRIEAAFENAVDYYESFTSIEKDLNVYYNPDVATADGHINGTIRVGSNPSYQQTGTALHEIMHTVGVGQHWRWGELISGGDYQGERANTILQVMTQDSTEIIHGDNLHFWPYGINGAHEDNGEEMLYITHALILQGMKEDGLPGSN